MLVKIQTKELKRSVCIGESILWMFQKCLNVWNHILGKLHRHWMSVCLFYKFKPWGLCANSTLNVTVSHYFWIKKYCHIKQSVPKPPAGLFKVEMIQRRYSFSTAILKNVSSFGGVVFWGNLTKGEGTSDT